MKNKMQIKSVKFAVIQLVLLGLAGCGGGDGNSGSSNGAIDTLPSVITAPGGLYVGYFQEDPVGNPEDPESGAFTLTLPEKDAALTGSMSFAYVDCQNSNGGTVAGGKSGQSLVGTWSAVIDNSTQSGSYSGTYSAASGYYQGVYVNLDGKQFKNVSGCLQHYLAANGNWAAFPVEQNQPSSFSLAVTGAAVSWPASTGTTSALVSVLDSAAALSGSGNAVVFQRLVSGTGTNFSLTSAGLIKGKEYIVAVSLSNASSVRIAFSSKRFIAS